MFRTLLRAVLRHLVRKPKSAPPAPPQAWRSAPTKTWSNDDVGDGLAVTMTIATGHHGFQSVVGESHYQETLQSLAHKLGPTGVFTARLVPETDNRYDANAVAVRVDDSLAQVGHLPRQVARIYHPRLTRHPAPVTCPARLTGGGSGTVGVVLDFENVRDALGLPRVSVDQGDMDFDAAAEYHRLNKATRLFVQESRSLERSDVTEAIARYRRAVNMLCECRNLAQAKGLEAYGFTVNQTDAIPIDRLILCLIKIGKVDEATTELDRFIAEFPHASQMTLVKVTRERINRVRVSR